MDVFGIALAAGAAFFRDAAIDAAYELGLLDGPVEARGHRMRALLEYLAELGVVVRDGARFVPGAVPPRPVVARAGWGRMAEVIRTNKPLPVEGGAIEQRYHEQLVLIGAPAARELAALLDGDTLVELGAGAGTYTAAFLDAQPAARAVVVDYDEVIALARDHLARFGDRVTFVASDIHGADARGDVVLLANVLHLHAPEHCAALVEAAARMVKPGGRVVLKDLRADTLEGRAFALNMAIYTGGGDVHAAAQLRAWLAHAGLVGIEEHAIGDAVALIAHRPRGSIAVFEATTGLTPAIELPSSMPRGFRTMLAHAATLAPDVLPHYLETMPAMREAQLREPLFAMPLDWSRLPRLSAVFERFGAAKARTLGEWYATTHYGGFMPLLYAYPADLAYFASRGLDEHAMIDRYLAAPVAHELSHFGRDREALLPLHLDECIAGWIGVHLWPGLAYPEEHDDAIYAAPWLAQVGQAIARAFGIDAVMRAHRGDALWDAVLPKWFVDEATELGWRDWCARRSLHFLADTLDPEPWIALAFSRGVPDDPAFDRVVVGDALRAMCLDNTCIAGSFRTRAAVPDAAIVIDARACRVTTARRGDVDRVAPRYWLPPAVGAALVARGQSEVRVQLASIDDIPAIVERLCQNSPTTSP